MCGRFNVHDNHLLRGLMSSLGVAAVPEPRLNIAPGAMGQFVIEAKGTRQLMDGYWSLLIEPRPEGKPGFRPNPKFKTFNARSDRLQESPLWRGRFRNNRAIIPVSGFHEWAGKQCFQIDQPDRALALGGLYDYWQFGDEIVPAFTIITLPPHPKLAHIHDKSIPLMLEPKDYDTWLDPAYTQVEGFWSLMQPVLHHPLRVTPILSPATLAVTPDAQPQLFAADL